MDNRLIINGLDLSEMGIGDVPAPVSEGSSLIAIMANDMVRQILGSITFGPVMVDYGSGCEETEDDEDWELAE
jgi:hypothetical protein